MGASEEHCFKRAGDNFQEVIAKCVEVQRRKESNAKVVTSQGCWPFLEWSNIFKWWE